MTQTTRFYWLGLKEQPQATGGSANKPGLKQEHTEALAMDAERSAEIATEEAKNAAEDAGFLNEGDTQTDGGEGIAPDLPLTEEEAAELAAANVSTEAGVGHPPYYA